MPNYCNNYVRISGEAGRVDEVMELVTSPIADFDFGQIVPIPYVYAFEQDLMVVPAVAILARDEKLRRRAHELSEKVRAYDPSPDKYQYRFYGDPQLLEESSSLAGELYERFRASGMALPTEEQARDGSQYFAEQGLDAGQVKLGAQAWNALFESQAFWRGNISDLTTPLWGGRGPLGEEPVVTLQERGNQDGVDFANYCPVTAWSPAIQAIRVLAERNPDLQVDFAYSVEGNPEVGIYRFKDGVEECLFDGNFYEELKTSGPAAGASPFDIYPQGDAYVQLSAEQAKAIRQGKTVSYDNFLDGLSIGTAEDADIRLDHAPKEDNEWGYSEVECSYQGARFLLVFEFGED